MGPFKWTPSVSISGGVGKSRAQTRRVASRQPETTGVVTPAARKWEKATKEKTGEEEYRKKP